MKTDNVKDAFLKEINELLQKDENLLWEGNPNPKFSVTLLEFGGHYDVMTGPTSILGFIIAPTLFFGYLFYSNENWISLTITIIFGLFGIILPDIIKNIRKKNTKYAVSNQRIFFHLWHYGKKSIHTINMSDIGKITYLEYDDKSGVINFLPKRPMDFDTYDFVSGKKRFYPTFEMIPNVINLQMQLEEIRKANLKK